jgi:hypothetical protein
VFGQLFVCLAVIGQLFVCLKVIGQFMARCAADDCLSYSFPQSYSEAQLTSPAMRSDLGLQFLFWPFSGPFGEKWTF